MSCPPASTSSGRTARPSTTPFRGATRRRSSSGAARASWGPLGNVLAEPDFAGESVRLAELDRADIVRGKFDFDVVGHYARPDIFSLGVNERPLEPVTATGPGAREA